MSSTELFFLPIRTQKQCQGFTGSAFSLKTLTSSDTNTLANRGIRVNDAVHIEDLRVDIAVNASTCEAANFLIVGVLLHSEAALEQTLADNFVPIPLRTHCVGQFELWRAFVRLQLIVLPSLKRNGLQ